MAFDQHPALGILLEEGHQRIQITQCARAEFGFAGLKQDVTEGEALPVMFKGPMTSVGS